MAVFLYSFNTVAPLILVVAVGFLLKKLKMVDSKFISKANKVCFQVAFPLQLFQNIYDADFQVDFRPRLVAFTLAGVLATAVLLCVTAPRFLKSRPTCGAFIQGVFRSNFLLLGLPLAVNLFGEEHVASISMLLPFVIMEFNFLAVVILTLFQEDAGGGRSRLRLGRMAWDVIKNPLIIASFVGMVFSVFQIPVPLFLSRAVGDIGQIATPFALILLGGQFDWKQLRGNLRLAGVATLLRLVVVPAVFVALGVWLGFRGEDLGALLIVFCAPTAISSYVMAQNMGSDDVLAGQLVLVTTLFSSVTIFLWVTVLRALQLI
ncbi:MAG TPA: AEC family transporter [Candidatus Fimivicinus intestinavium]|nr:AEC family transporter [Candidatus Fimivicinus intestinavium]